MAIHDSLCTVPCLLPFRFLQCCCSKPWRVELIPLTEVKGTQALESKELRPSFKTSRPTLPMSHPWTADTLQECLETILHRGFSSRDGGADLTLSPLCGYVQDSNANNNCSKDTASGFDSQGGACCPLGLSGKWQRYCRLLKPPPSAHTSTPTSPGKSPRKVRGWCLTARPGGAQSRRVGSLSLSLSFALSLFCFASLGLQGSDRFPRWPCSLPSVRWAREVGVKQLVGLQFPHSTMARGIQVDDKRTHK